MNSNRNNQVIRIILSIIAIIALILYLIIQTPKRVISYEILSESPIVDISEIGLKDIVVRYRNQTLNKLNVIALRIYNAGNTNILRSEFEGNIRIQFNADNNVIFAKIGETIPPNMQPALSYSRNALEIQPLLLNPDDAMTIQMFVTGKTVKPLVSARIIGVKSISEKTSLKETKKISSWNRFDILASMMLYGYLGMIIINSILKKRSSVTFYKTELVIVVLLISNLMTSFFALIFSIHTFFTTQEQIWLIISTSIGTAIGNLRDTKFNAKPRVE